MNYTKQNSNGHEDFLLASIPAAGPLDSLNVWPGILCTRMRQIIRIFVTKFHIQMENVHGGKIHKTRSIIMVKIMLPSKLNNCADCTESVAVLLLLAVQGGLPGAL